MRQDAHDTDACHDPSSPPENNRQVIIYIHTDNNIRIGRFERGNWWTNGEVINEEIIRCWHDDEG